MKRALVIVSAVAAALFASVLYVSASVADGVATAIASATPLGGFTTTDAAGKAIQAAQDLAAHKWQPAIAALLMLLVWAGHQPWAGGFLNRLGRWHNPVLLGVGGILSAVADHLMSGGSWTVSAVIGVLTPIMSSGLWEHLYDPTPKAQADPAAAVKAAVAEAMKLPPAERDAALAKIGSGS